MIMCCIFTYSSYAQKKEYLPPLIAKNTIQLEDVIKNKRFLNEFIDSNFNEEFRVFVKTNDQRTLSALNQMGKNVNTFRSYSGLAVTLTKTNLVDLIQEGGISGVWENSRLYSVDGEYSFSSLNYTQDIANFTEMVSTTPIWAVGFYGSDTKVAILDTGIKTDHLALNVTMSGNDRIVDSWNFISDNSNVEDDNGHGTEVAGIIGSNGLYGYHFGVAPNCSFMIGKILDYNGMGTLELLIQGIDWAIENDADIINLSLGSIVTDRNSPDIEAVNNAVSNGTMVCVAAGNMRGIEELGYNDMFTILTPGIAKQAITVGAIDNNYMLYETSSAGPVAIQYNEASDSFVYDDINLDKTWLKPDVVAPGVMLNTTAFGGQTTKLVSGTSYATAVVSGVCSLLKQIFPDNKPSTFKASLLETSIDISPEIMSPLGDKVEISIPSIYQGAGLVNVSKAGPFLINPPSITFWPKRIPFTQEVYFLNEYDSFYLSIFINKQISSLSYKYYELYRPYFEFSYFPRNPKIGQHDILVNFSTKEKYYGLVNFPIHFNDGFIDYDLNVSFYLTRGKGRILYDVNEIGDENRFSLYGNLNGFFDISKYFGLITKVLPRADNSQQISSLDLRDYEVIALLNHNSSSLHEFTSADEEAILDYLLPGGDYHGGTVIFFPTRSSDFNSLNSILEHYDITYSVLMSDNETLDLSSIIHPLTSNYNTIGILSLILPLEVLKVNDTYNSIADRFVYNDTRQNSGSLVLACNNLEMFLNSPYLYNSLTSNYEEKQSSLQFGDNYQMLENIMVASTVSDISMNYSISSTESQLNSEIQVTISALNNYEPLTGWDFFLSLETLQNVAQKIEIKYYDFIDFKNGTYIFHFTPGIFPIPGGSYFLSVRSSYDTMTWTVYLMTDYSWGPTLITISIAACMLLFVIFRKKQTKL